MRIQSSLVFLICSADAISAHPMRTQRAVRTGLQVSYSLTFAHISDLSLISFPKIIQRKIKKQAVIKIVLHVAPTNNTTVLSDTGQT